MLNPEKETIVLRGAETLPVGSEQPRCVEPVVWVFPIYSWGVPPVVERYMGKVKMKGGYEATHFMVCTCGDDVGRADHQWRSIIGKRGWHPAGAFSVQMPNTYVLMKGFDIDPAVVASEKLSLMPARVDHIAGEILRGSCSTDVVRGSGAFFKSALIYPVFRRFCMSPKGFRSTEACVGCGLCARRCPMENITMSEGRPRWGSNCAMCLRCYHICPSHAVGYEHVTEGKGQKEVFE